MFLRCVIINKTATTIENAVNMGNGLPKKRFKIIGNEIPAEIDESDTNLVLNNVIKKTIKARQVATGKIQITIPKIVATPFPPLNPAKTGKICPTKTATPKPSCKFVN